MGLGAHPVMIGEFHIGSLDRGLLSDGIRNTLTMEESVRAYHLGLYEIVVGRKEPFSERPNTVPQGTLCW